MTGNELPRLEGARHLKYRNGVPELQGTGYLDYRGAEPRSLEVECLDSCPTTPIFNSFSACRKNATYSMCLGIQARRAYNQLTEAWTVDATVYSVYFKGYT